jgi:hypothetical protein
LAVRINQRGKLNILDLNLYAENFYAELFNLIFNYRLVNMNAIQQNVEGIDLIDTTNQIIIQVSSTATKTKVEKSLKKNIFLLYPGYRFKFISIAKDASELKDDVFKNPHGVLFEPTEDILDVNTILRNILNKEIDAQKNIYEFIKKELGNDLDIVKIDSNLAAIINILSMETLTYTPDPSKINSFEIERKIWHNELKSVKTIIDDYKVYQLKVNEKYTEFDKQGANKSYAVLQTIRKQYIILRDQIENSDILFLKIMEYIIEIVKSSKNYCEISFEELEMYVGILVVDAFIRCKIFENPEGYDYAIAR